ncbi:MAG: valine--tRNA ligase [Myxococcales bacterium]|nr:valine--tRNA ligase [Myxococcales bacterium]
MASDRDEFLSVDPEQLPKHFDSTEAESRWDASWTERGVHAWDPARPREDSFVVDTPPPTASGTLHPGHMFSYTHTDILVRHKRMRGLNVYYPMGWDDNGLPTERRVQNYYHVRCDPNLQYESGLVFEEANAKARKKPPRHISRPNFVELCEILTAEDEKSFEALWRRLGISVDWNLQYQTIDEHCRRIAQLSFCDLWTKGHLYNSDAPTMWDVDFHCAIAQAEVEDKVIPGAYHDLEFGVEGSDDALVISTTRPELLPACVGVTAHPDDERYRGLFGKRAVTPLFRVPVPIFPSELADPEKGTGILMVCTFGDATDVLWWREQGLALRQLVGFNGRLAAIEFGSPGFESLDPEAANRSYAELAGKSVAAARKAIVELLRDSAGSATGNGAPLQAEPRAIEHPVKFYEKGDRPLEFVPTRQWYVRLLDKKEALLEKGREIRWLPDHMGKRFSDWTEHLTLDWCVSRQRYFGVPIPVWYPLDSEGAPDYDAPIVADAARLPVDPTTDLPPGYTEAQRGEPGGFIGEKDIFDTWFTSSMTPQISSHWGTDPQRHERLFPADMRPQAHDIIRTWAFYTIAKAMLHEDQVPWHHAAISGWILDPDRKKMSKSKGNVVTPLPLIEQYTADAIRYWSGSARLGVDTAMDEKVYKVGKRLVTKIFNAGKFVLAQTGSVQPVTNELDRAFVAELLELVDRATGHFDAFDQAHALMETETFFWSRFTDTYLELVKNRARAEDPAERGSAIAALRTGLSVLLRLFAPTLPYITEEVWSWAFAEETGHPTIHRAPWPDRAEFPEIAPPTDTGSLDLAVDALATINKAKSDGEVSMGREVTRMVLSADAATLDRLRPVLSDVLQASRCAEHELREDAALEPGTFSVPEIEFAPKPPKPPKN